MLSINPDIQRWQRRELAERQSDAEYLFESFGGVGAIFAIVLILVGLVVGFTEVHAFAARPVAGFYIAASGVATVFSLLPYAAFGQIALDLYQHKTIY